MFWRLTFDVPHNFATEPGYVHSGSSSGFILERGTHENVWLDPASGLLMLKPHWHEKSWAGDIWDITSFRYSAGFWKQTKRAPQQANLLASVFKAGATADSIALTDITAPVYQVNSVAGTDYLVWVLESVADLAQDQGIVVHYHGITDEMLRDNNWFKIMWDNIGLHFTYSGQCRVVKFNRANMTQAPVLVHEFQFGNPGEILGRYGALMFLPIPGVGISFNHIVLGAQQNVVSFHRSVRTYKSYLIPWDSWQGQDGFNHMFDASKVRLAMNPQRRHLVGVAPIKFITSGNFWDKPIDPGYKPSQNPQFFKPLTLLTVQKNNVTATLEAANSIAAWVPLTDRQAKVKLALSTTNEIYTPFVYGYSVGWYPVYVTRNTTPVTPAKFFNLEFTQTEDGKFEGNVEVEMRTTAQKAIAERGDSTFLLENSLDNVNWMIVDGGFAKDWRLTSKLHLPFPGFHYRCQVALRGMHERFEELHQLFKTETALDSATLAESLNVVFVGSGFSPLPDASFPQVFHTTRVPGSGADKKWKWGIRRGDQATEIIRKILAMASAQYQEYRTLYDWANNRWLVELKPRDISAGGLWVLIPQMQSSKQTYTGGLRYGVYSTIELNPRPPEANTVIVEGLSSPDETADRVVSPPAYNKRSVEDTTSPHYLGRSKHVVWSIYPLSESSEAFRWARRLFAIIGVRDFHGSVSLPRLYTELSPCKRLQLWEDNAGSRVIGNTDVWIKRRTISVPMNHCERMTLEVSSIWEGHIGGG